MNLEQDDQTKWLITYLESRFSRLDDRLNRSEDKLQELLDSQSSRLEEINRQIDQLESRYVKLDSQAGFVKNMLAFTGTAVLSLLGWLVSTFVFPTGK